MKIRKQVAKKQPKKKVETPWAPPTPKKAPPSQPQPQFPSQPECPDSPNGKHYFDESDLERCAHCGVLDCDVEDQPKAPIKTEPTKPVVPAKPVTPVDDGLGECLVKASQTSPHLEVRALAGTGKTTTVIEGVMGLKGVKRSITPSPQQAAVWQQLEIGKSDTIRLSAFNTAITDELKARLQRHGLDKKGCEARGVHSLGNGAVYKAFGKQEATEWGVRDLIADELHGNYRDLKGQVGMASVLTATEELVSLCKQTMTAPEPDNLDTLTSYYDIETNGQREKIYDLVPKILTQCRQPKGRIHFDDMVWLPVVLGLPIYKVDVQIIDEAQDLNRMQQELIYRAGHRIIFVGDPHQAIYGFAGSDVNSMPRMADTLSATGRKCLTLPLTVTRRCGKAIVEEARRIVSEFEAHESNGQGIVTDGVYPIRSKNSLGEREVPWEKSYCSKVQPGDRIICRVNAPLVSQCFRFLKRNIKATILGRKIGEGLVSMIEKSKAHTIEMLLGWLEDWLTREMFAENNKKHPSEQRLIALQDKHDCLVCFAQDCESVDEVVKKIKTIFTEDKSNPGVQLSSIHKSKGLEANRVFFLMPEGAECPHPMAKTDWQREQEMNLLYVAITRAIKELVYVR